MPQTDRSSPPDGRGGRFHGEGEAGLLQGADRVGDIDGVAKAGVGVDDQRQIDHAANGHGVLGDLAQIHEAEIRQAEMHVGQPRPGQIDSLEAEIGEGEEPPLVERRLDDHPEIVAAYDRYRPNWEI